MVVVGGLVVSSAPATEPITATEAKLFARISTTADDALVTDLITAARVYAEPILNRTFVDTTFVWTLDAFPAGGRPLLFPRPPLSAVTSITYVDSDGTTQTWSSSLYDTDTATLVGRVLPAFGQSYPATRAQMNAVTVTYVAGDGAIGVQREDVKLLMKVLVAESYEKRLLTTDRRVYLNEQADSLMWELSIPNAA